MIGQKKTKERSIDRSIVSQKVSFLYFTLFKYISQPFLRLRDTRAVKLQTNKKMRRKKNLIERSTNDAYHFCRLFEFFFDFPGRKKHEAIQIELNNITDSVLFEMKDNIIIPRAKSTRWLHLRLEKNVYRDKTCEIFLLTILSSMMMMIDDPVNW